MICFSDNLEESRPRSFVNLSERASVKVLDNFTSFCSSVSKNERKM